MAELLTLAIKKKNNKQTLDHVSVLQNETLNAQFHVKAFL